MVSTVDLPFNIYSKHTVENWLGPRTSSKGIPRSRLFVHRDDPYRDHPTDDLFIQCYQTDIIRIGANKIWATCNGYPTKTTLRYLTVLTGVQWKLSGGSIAVTNKSETWYMSPKDMLGIKQTLDSGGILEYIFPDNVVLPQVNPIHINALCKI